MATDIVKEITAPKKALKHVLFGLLVVFLAGLLGGFIPSIMEIPVVGFSIGHAVAAGLAAILSQWAFDNWYPF